MTNSQFSIFGAVTYLSIEGYYSATLRIVHPQRCRHSWQPGRLPQARTGIFYLAERDTENVLVFFSRLSRFLLSHELPPGRQE